MSVTSLNNCRETILDRNGAGQVANPLFTIVASLSYVLLDNSTWRNVQLVTGLWWQRTATTQTKDNVQCRTL